MWTVQLHDDPLQQTTLRGGAAAASTTSTDHITYVAHAQCHVNTLFRGSSEQKGDADPNSAVIDVLRTSGRVACVAFADYVARQLLLLSQSSDSTASVSLDSPYVRWEPLDWSTTLHRRATKHHHNGSRPHQQQQQQQNQQNHARSSTPFMLERTDVVLSHPDHVLHMFLRVFVLAAEPASRPISGTTVPLNSLDGISTAPIATSKSVIRDSIASDLASHFAANTSWTIGLMPHLAVAVFQDRLRSLLRSDSGENAVAFVANGSILPRKSGASAAPMSSPPAVSFVAPTDSPLARTVAVDMGPLLYSALVPLVPHMVKEAGVSETTIIQLTGLLIPRGVSLIVGGGYHGKSTLLRCLAAGVYNKIPGDGREFCVTVEDAVTVRAEDGRYVRNCNVSAFISNLPIPNLDTKKFSTEEASGSTSQAANVVEVIEMGASAMLVDEDVSAANFMARDGRMRSLVMDESITPLLYRVNGLYTRLDISSIVVVGGVGDWLDVPDAVILMDRYLCKDATAKARSISNQFSHGHVQYGGRGVVHRLQWENSGTPTPRRPAVPSTHSRYRLDMDHTAITLLDGSNSMSPDAIDSVTCNDADVDAIKNGAIPDSDDDECYIDMSRCEQLMGRKPQLYGCGLCLVWLLKLAELHPSIGIAELLRKMDATLDEKGLLGLILDDDQNVSASWIALVETLGFAYRPRRFEVGQALTRFRGLILEPLPVEDDGVEEAARADAERRRNELLDIWNNRRRNPLEQIHQDASSPTVSGVE